MTNIVLEKSNLGLDYPSRLPTLNIDFTHERLDPRISFSRNSIGTRVNRFGYIEQISANKPRFDYDPITKQMNGLLIEEQRTNLINYSANLASWTNPGGGTVTANTTETLAPDGTYSATKISPSPGTNYANGYGISNAFGTYTPGDTYSLSFYIKSGGSNATSFAIAANGTTSANQTFWITGIPIDPKQSYSYISVGSNSIPSTHISNLGNLERIQYPNGWTKFILYDFTISNTATCKDLIIQHTGYAPIIGSPLSTMYIWGVQLEKGNFPSSYIPTSGSQVTRNSDSVKISSNDFSSFFNSNEGTIILTGRSNESRSEKSVGETRRFVELSDGTSSNNIFLGFTTPRTQLSVTKSSSITSNVINFATTNTQSNRNFITLIDPFGGYTILETKLPHGLKINDIIRVSTSSNGMLVNTNYYVSNVDSLTRFSLGTSIGNRDSFTYGVDLSIPFYTYSSLQKRLKIAGAYKNNNAQQATNGILGSEDFNVIFPETIDEISIGADGALTVGKFLNGTIENFTYYDYRLTNQQLVNMTV